MLEGLKKRFLRLFLSREKLMARERKRAQKIFQRTFEKKLKQYEKQYRKKNRLQSGAVIPPLDRKEIITRATSAANEKINERHERKSVKKINLESHGILFNVTYAAGVTETTLSGFSPEEQDMKEMEDMLHLSKSPRGNIAYLDFHNQFHGDVEAMAFYRTYFDPNTELGRKIWDTLKIDLNSNQPVEQQKRNLLNHFWRAAKKATGFKALFIPGRKSRYNILRRIQQWFIYQEESLNSNMRLGLNLHERPSRKRIFIHFFERLGLNFLRVITLGLFLPFIDTVHYARKNPILFCTFTALAILCFFVPPLTVVPATIAALIGLSHLSGIVYTAAFIIAAVYGTSLWTIIAIKTVNTFSKMFSDIKIILNDKDFWLWEMGRYIWEKGRYIFGENTTENAIDKELSILMSGKSPIQQASTAKQVAAKTFIKEAVVPQEKKYVLEFKPNSVKVHAPTLMNTQIKEITFAPENLNQLRYLYNFMDQNRDHVDEVNKKLVRLGRLIRGTIMSANTLETLHQEIAEPTTGIHNIPVLPGEFHDTTQVNTMPNDAPQALVDADDGAGVGVPAPEATGPNLARQPITDFELLQMELEGLMFEDFPDDEEEGNNFSLATLKELQELAKQVTG
ncbi:MAG: hypothetical protein ABSF18_04485, partial [Gammaproteobacteria bacterium]